MRSLSIYHFHFLRDLTPIRLFISFPDLLLFCLAYMSSAIYPQNFLHYSSSHISNWSLEAKLSLRYQKLIRIHRVIHISWITQLHHLESINAQLTELYHAEQFTILYSNTHIPPELTRSRIHFLHIKRSSLHDKKIIELAKAQALGIRLKRIERLLSKINDPS